MLSINFPEKFTPDLTDNFVSNKAVFKDLGSGKVPDGLLDTDKWETYYEGSPDVHTYNQDSTVLKNDTCLHFRIFGLGVKAQAEGYDLDVENGVLRLAWHGWNEAEGGEFLDVYHTWLIQKLGRNRVRILTQESQIGTPVKELAKPVPSTMMPGHQAWLDELVAFAKYWKK